MRNIEKKSYKSDQQRVEKIRGSDEHVFEQLYFEYFYNLCAFALRFTGSKEQARDIVQEIFYKLWKRRKNWRINSSLKAYLFRAVRNEALNYLDKEQHRLDVKEEFTREFNLHKNVESDELSPDDLEMIKRIWKIVRDMPSRRQSVFVLHRRHGLSYNEISDVLNISRKTVENHMGLALDEIREKINNLP